MLTAPPADRPALRLPPAAAQPERPAPISTPAELLEALRLGIVAEVAPTLFATIGPAESFLTQEGRSQAWVMGSASLYDLLVLNRRWPVSAAEAASGALISQKALVGLGRIVGFDLQRPSELSASVLVFTAHPDWPDNGGLGLPLVPTVATFGAEINALRPATATPIPAEIFQALDRLYAEATAAGATPVDVFEIISGGGAEPDPWRQAIYAAAVEAIRQGGWPPPTAEGVARFFSDFAEPVQTARLPGWQEALQIGVRALLAETFRASPLWSSLGIGFAPAANPLVGLPVWQLEGDQRYAGQEFLLNNVQYRSVDAATLEGGAQSGSGAWLNGPLIWELVRGPALGAIPPDSNYLVDGWFALDPPVQLGSGVTPLELLPSGLDEYTWSAEIVASGAVVAFRPESVSSDTISAAGVDWIWPFLTPRTVLESRAGAGSDPITGLQLQELPGLVHDLLPAGFATYIAAGGGTDAITGSPLRDVVVGPGPLAPHGQLSVDLLAGDDLLAPGRGGGLVRLGSGSDRLVFDANNLFGQTVLLDFSGLEDQVVIERDIVASGFGSDLLTLTNPFDQSVQTLLLSGISEEQWRAEWVVVA